MIPLGVLASGYVAAGGGGGLMFIGSQAGGTGMSVTFSGVPIGTPSTTRTIVVIVHGIQSGATLSLSNITVGGASATIDQHGSGYESHAIAHVMLATGATADVTVTFNRTVTASHCIVYTIEGTLTKTASAQQSAWSVSQTVATSDGGCAVATVTTNSTTSSISWAGMDEDYEAVGGQIGAASLALTDGTDITVAAASTAKENMSVVTYALA